MARAMLMSNDWGGDARIHKGDMDAMATMRVHKTADYTVMSNRHFRERGMTLKAKGLLSLMLSLPEDWDYSVNGLATLSKDGRDSVNGALRELERFGYLVRTKTTDGAGRFTGYDYDIYEDPEDAPFGGKPPADKPCAENPYTGKPEQSITKQQSTDQPSTEGSVEEDKNDIPDKDKGARRPIGKSLLEKYEFYETGPNGEPQCILNEKDQEALVNARALHSAEEKIYLKPTALTKMLIRFGYLAKEDPYIGDYNAYLGDCVRRYGWEAVRNSVAYFTKRIKLQGNLSEINDRLAYFKAAMETGLERTSPEYQEEVERRLSANVAAETALANVRRLAEQGDGRSKSLMAEVYGEDQPGQSDSPETCEINQARIDESIRKIEAGSESERDWLVKACIEHEEARELLAESFCGGARQAKVFLMSLCSWESGDKERIASIYDGGDGE